MDNKGYRSSSNSRQNHPTMYLHKSFSEHPFGLFESRPGLCFEQPKSITRSSSASSSSRLSKLQHFFRNLRRKFTKEKKAFGSGNHADLVIVPYNSYTYAKNFEDKDMVLAEPDNLFRSFSARFAVSSSGMLKRVQSVR